MCRMTVGLGVHAVAALLPSLVHAQVPSILHEVRMEAGAALQPANRLTMDAAESLHRSRHLFVDLSFRRSISDATSIGAGLGLSWGTYGVSVRGLALDTAGSQLVEDGRWSPFVWYPFSKQGSGKSWSTDPLTIYALASTRIWRYSPTSVLTCSAMAGAMLPNGIYLSVDTDARLNPPSGAEPFRASTEWGDRWHGLLGCSLEWACGDAQSDKLLIGFHARASFDGYYRQVLALAPFSSPANEVVRNQRLFWLGFKVGYGFCWKRMSHKGSDE